MLRDVSKIDATSTLFGRPVRLPVMVAPVGSIESFTPGGGATAARSLLGPGFQVTKQRGEVLEVEDRTMVATVHPSSILRGPSEDREQNFDALVDDLRVVAGLLG